MSSCNPRSPKARHRGHPYWWEIAIWFPGHLGRPASSITLWKIDVKCWVCFDNLRLSSHSLLRKEWQRKRTAESRVRRLKSPLFVYASMADLLLAMAHHPQGSGPWELTISTASTVINTDSGTIARLLITRLPNSISHFLKVVRAGWVDCLRRLRGLPFRASQAGAHASCLHRGCIPRRSVESINPMPRVPSPSVIFSNHDVGAPGLDFETGGSTNPTHKTTQPNA